MSRVNRISCVEQKDGSIDIVVPASMVEDFKLMVKKGTNLSPDMHVEIRDFVDRLLERHWNGTCMKQEIYGYSAQAEELAAASNGIISTHWDIPAEDKYLLASGEQAQVITKQSPKESDYGKFLGTISKNICQGHPETCNCPQHTKD